MQNHKYEIGDKVLLKAVEDEHHYGTVDEMLTAIENETVFEITERSYGYRIDDNMDTEHVPDYRIVTSDGMEMNKFNIGDKVFLNGHTADGDDHYHGTTAVMEKWIANKTELEIISGVYDLQLKDWFYEVQDGDWYHNYNMHESEISKFE